MRQTYHICLASHDEVLFRSENDLARGINCFAVACVKTESKALSDGFMPTHYHLGVQTDNVPCLMKTLRYSYARYFNSTYRRKGKLAETSPFIIALEGIRHTLAALSYINRQALHHGICETPFAYRHCSVNAFFRKELGKWNVPAIMPPWKRRRYLPDTYPLPESFRMSAAGELLQEDFIDTNYVEELYMTPRNFLFHMNRISEEEWKREQAEEKIGSQPVTLELIENGVPDIAIQTMLLAEKGRVNKSILTDLELCNMIDGDLVPQYFNGKSRMSIYDLPLSVRQDIGNRLAKNMTAGGRRIASLKQIKRCLVI